MIPRAIVVAFTEPTRGFEPGYGECEHDTLHDLVGEEAVRARAARLVGEYGDRAVFEVVEDGLRVSARQDLRCGRLVNRAFDRPGFDTSFVKCIQSGVCAKEVLSVLAG